MDISSLVSVDSATLRQLIVKLLQRKGMFAAEAEIAADRMIEADLDRQYAEGTGSVAEYIDAMDVGDIDPRARLITISETPAVALLDGSTGMGHVATTNAMLMAIAKANEVGVGTVVVKNSRPAGDLGSIVRLAANQGLIGQITSSFGEAGDSIAYAVPAPSGMVPLVDRHRHVPEGLAVFNAVLSAGLAAADAHPRKRKAMRAANAVEYHVQAINPDKFGTRDALYSKWKTLWRSAEVDNDVSAQISIPSSVAQELSALAAKIKFAVTW